jgi:hypothetical protein
LPDGVAWTPAESGFTLDDRYQREQGTVYLTGTQAVVRLLLDRIRHDRRRGLNTGAFMSGYEGSPLAGLDLKLARRASLLSGHDVVHRPGLDGGSDAFRHACLVGTHPRGGALGLHAVEMSHASGVWAAMKMVTNVADAASTAVMLGAAYQSGAIGLRAAAIERAIVLNGVAVERNLQAFRRGRQWQEPNWRCWISGYRTSSATRARTTPGRTLNSLSGSANSKTGWPAPPW